MFGLKVDGNDKIILCQDVNQFGFQISVWRKMFGLKVDGNIFWSESGWKIFWDESGWKKSFGLKVDGNDK